MSAGAATGTLGSLSFLDSEKWIEFGGESIEAVPWVYCEIASANQQAEYMLCDAPYAQPIYLVGRRSAPKIAHPSRKHGYPESVHYFQSDTSLQA